ncbi:MAG: hypothetical protein ACLRR4_10715 [Blautia sp.]
MNCVNRGDASPPPVRPCVMRMAAVEKGMKKSTVGETVLSFIFIFKGRRADFLIGNMKKKIV